MLWTKIRYQFNNSSIKCHFKDIGNNLKNVCILCNIKNLLNLFNVRMILYACRDVYWGIYGSNDMMSGFIF